MLKVIGGPNNGAEFTMQTGHSYTIGTDPSSCDVVFHDTSISRQHARITANENNTLTIEDLKSRNGTLIDGKPCTESTPLETNMLVSIGTTSFIIFDREGDMQTIISPLLPSIVKVLQKDAEEKTEEQKLKSNTELTPQIAKEPEIKEIQKPRTRFIFIGIISSLFLLAGFGIITLFQSTPIQMSKPINYDAELAKAIEKFPSVRYSYTRSTGQLLLVGHVLTLSDKNQLLYNLQALDFLKSLDDSGLIVDEFVWRETNSILNRDARWKGISIHSPTAGTFILSGYLQTRKQAEELNDYITSNFPYLDLLERRVIVEEDILSSAEITLQNSGIKNIKAQMNNGELTLSGGLSKEQMVTFDRLLPEIRKIPGVRNIKTFINETEQEQSLINITDRYPVTGSSHQGGSNITVIINGRILSRGDSLDGMTITSIRQNAIFLEKDGTKYKIDYNQQ